jgi:ankyrin repeat protein
VQVNRLEVTNSRNALMQCAFDPQSNHTWMLDNNCTTIAKRLVGAGANVSHIDKHGWNAIAFGAMKGFTKYVKYLLGKGADIDNKDSAGRTPLMKAVTHGHVNTTQILLEGGADVSIVDSHGWSALHFSTRQLGDTMPAHYMKIFKMLVHIDSPTLSVRQQDKKGKAKKSKDNSQVTTKKPIKSRKKLPIDAKDSDGRTALMYATLMNSNELISLLLEAGADPTVEDSQGLTAYALSRVELTRVQLAQASADWATRQHEEWLRRREARNPHLNKETCAASQP